MDVSGVGPGPQPANFGTALRAVTHAATPSGTIQSAGDIFVSTLQEVSDAEMTVLLDMIGRPESPQQAQRLDDLLRAAVSATAEGNVDRAMVPLTELAMMSPQRAQTLASLPSLSSIRGPIERLVSRLSAAAKVEAESQLAQAVKLMESAVAKELMVREIRAQNLILTAGRLLDAGGYATSVWSAQLSQMVIDPRLWAPNAVPLPLKVQDADGRSPTARGGVFAAIRLVCAGLQLKSRIRRMWFRAPLLVLLLAWFVVGLVGGVFSALVRNYWPRALSTSLIAGSFELWALGFLVLVAVGLYVSVRNV